MIIKCLGGCREVGKNAFLIKGQKENILLDYGVEVETGTLPIDPGQVDHAFIAHAHLDHTGGTAVLMKQKTPPQIYSTSVTFEMIPMLLKDSLKIARLKGHEQHYTEMDIRRMKKYQNNVMFGDSIQTKETTVDIHDSGHIPGSFIPIVNIQGKRILYTSDFGMSDSRLLTGTKIKELKNIDVAIMECTYSNKNHPDRKETEKKLYELARDTIENGGTALIPAFAVGRSAEVITALNSFKPKFPIYLDGMAKQATEITLNHPQFLRNAKELAAAVKKVNFIKNHEDRKDALKSPCAIVTTGGCIDGGPAVHYIKRLWDKPENTMIFTGYQIPKTAGRYLLDTGRYVSEEMDLKFKMAIHSLDFSGHAGRDELFEFVKVVRPKKVIAIHGDNCQRFATEIRGRFEDVEAVAPKNGDEFEL